MSRSSRTESTAGAVDAGCDPFLLSKMAMSVSPFAFLACFRKSAAIFAATVTMEFWFVDASARGPSADPCARAPPWRSHLTHLVRFGWGAEGSTSVDPRTTLRAVFRAKGQARARGH